MDKILVIDDEIEICKMIKRIFQKNFQVIFSVMGKEGIDLFYSEKPDIIILDIFLKDMSGFEILKKIKSYTPSCYIIMMTASRLEDKKMKAFDLGADNFINKPFNIKELKRIIFNNIASAKLIR